MCANKRRRLSKVHSVGASSQSSRECKNCISRYSRSRSIITYNQNSKRLHTALAITMNTLLLRVSLTLLAFFYYTTTTVVDCLSLGRTTTRRSILQKASYYVAAATSPTFISKICNAAPSDAQFVEVGQQEKPPNGETPFSTLSNGVQIKDFRLGSGQTVIQDGSKVVS